MDKLYCPFCKGPVRIVVCDDEGNYPRENGYEKAPWSGLGYIICHSEEEAKENCPIARPLGEDCMGRIIYDSREDARKARKFVRK